MKSVVGTLTRTGYTRPKGRRSTASGDAAHAAARQAHGAVMGLEAALAELERFPNRQKFKAALMTVRASLPAARAARDAINDLKNNR